MVLQCVLLLCVGESEDYENLLLTVEALKAQLEEQTRLCKEQVSLVPHAFPEEKLLTGRSYEAEIGAVLLLLRCPFR